MKFKNNQLIVYGVNENKLKHYPDVYANLVERDKQSVSLLKVTTSSPYTPPLVYVFGTDGIAMITVPMSTPIAGHKYYGAIMWRTQGNTFTAADNRFEWWCGDAANSMMVFANKGYATNGEWTKLSSIQSLSSVASGTWQIRNFLVNPSSTAYCSSMMIVDLTETFGAGNEPSKDWCDKYIVYDSYAIPNGDNKFSAGDALVCPYHLFEGGRRARYIRVRANGSNANQLDHLTKVYITDEFEETIPILDATIDFKSRAIEGLGGLVGSGESAYYNVDYSKQYVTFDIGEEKYVITILVRRYYPDSRYYYGHKIEGSLDNVNWFTLYDSGNTGSFGNDNQTNVYREDIYGKWFMAESDETLRFLQSGQNMIKNLREE